MDAKPTHLTGSFVVPPPAGAPATPDVSAVAGPPTALMPALPPVVADQPTDDLPAGSGRPADAATVTWLAGPGPGPRPYPRVVPRRHPGRALLLIVLVLLVAAAVVWAVVLS